MLGAYVRQRRLELGLEQAELAEATGSLDIDGNYITRLEKGHLRTVPKPHVLRALATGLRVSTVDLLIAAGYLDEDHKLDPGKTIRTQRETDTRRELTFIRDHLNSVIATIDKGRSQDTIVVNAP